MAEVHCYFQTLNSMHLLVILVFIHRVEYIPVFDYT
jgi:hypothetical protein